MVEISSSSREKKIHRVDNPFSNYSKNITFFPSNALISDEGLAGKWAITGTSVCRSGGSQHGKRTLASTPIIKIFLVPCFS